MSLLLLLSRKRKAEKVGRRLRKTRFKSIMWKSLVIVMLLSFLVTVAFAEAGNSVVKAYPWKNGKQTIQISDQDKIKKYYVYDKDDNVVAEGPTTSGLTSLEVTVTVVESKLPLKVFVRDCQTTPGEDWYRVNKTGETSGPYRDSGFTDPYPNKKTYNPLVFRGGIAISIDKLGLLAPYIGLASTILVATVATAVYVKRVKRREEKQ